MGNTLSSDKKEQRGRQESVVLFNRSSTKQKLKPKVLHPSQGEPTTHQSENTANNIAFRTPNYQVSDRLNELCRESSNSSDSLERRSNLFNNGAISVAHDPAPPVVTHTLYGKTPPEPPLGESPPCDKDVVINGGDFNRHVAEMAAALKRKAASAASAGGKVTQKDLQYNVADFSGETYDVLVKWKDFALQPTDKVFIVGKFKSSITEKIALTAHGDSWSVLLALPVGVYRFQFLINGELQHSNQLPIATDNVGQFVNWFEIVPSHHVLEPGVVRSASRLFHGPKTPQLSTEHLERPKLYTRDTAAYASATSIDLKVPVPTYQYGQDIPELFKVNYDDPQDETETETDKPAVPSSEPPPYAQTILDVNSNNVIVNEKFLEKWTIPELPVYLNSTYLNKVFSNNTMDKYAQVEDNINHIIPHVNLNHLLTSSIRDNVISVACTTRYEGKYVTQVVYSPAEGM